MSELEAREQVEAFLEHLKDRLDVDEAQIKRVVKKNGEFVTWAWVVSILIIFVASLLALGTNRLLDDIKELRDKQVDVRERLVVMERLLEQHMEGK